MCPDYRNLCPDSSGRENRGSTGAASCPKRKPSFLPRSSGSDQVRSRANSPIHRRPSLDRISEKRQAPLLYRRRIPASSILVTVRGGINPTEISSWAVTITPQQSQHSWLCGNIGRSLGNGPGMGRVHCVRTCLRLKWERHKMPRYCASHPVCQGHTFSVFSEMQAGDLLNSP